MKKIICLLAPVMALVLLSNCEKKKTKLLEDYTWEEINEISQSGKASEYFKVGDVKAVTLSIAGKVQHFTHRVRIIDFNYDKLAGKEGNAGITFEFADLITNGENNPSWVYKIVWDKTGYNRDYRESYLHKTLNNEASEDSIINRLPDDLKGVIKPIEKKVGVQIRNNGEDSYQALPFEEGNYPKLFPLAYDEISTTTHENVVVGEDSGKGAYQYYKDHPSEEDRIKRSLDISSVSDFYWLRSPDTHTDHFAWNVRNTGSIQAQQSYTVQDAIAPAFCI